MIRPRDVDARERIVPQHYKAMTQPERAKLRALYVEEQNGRCSHCGELLCDPAPLRISDKPINWRLFPGGRDFLRHPIHLHHSHKTGLTLGAVHAHCNAVLWQYHGE